MAKKKKFLIVKLQLSVATNAEVRQMLIYDKTRNYMYQGDVTPEVLETMEPKDKSYSFQKAYFKAHLVPDPKDNSKVRICLDEFVDPQPW